jgi:hypothetical protein
MIALGGRIWAIPEGYIPSGGLASDPALSSHEAACILNSGDKEARLTITVFFEDREPAGPYHMTVGARRTLHLRFNELTDPEPVPRDTNYASVIVASEPVVVQHTRLDSRNARVALLSTMAFSQP